MCVPTFMKKDCCLVSNVNKDLTFKAKDKDQTLKAKDQDKDCCLVFNRTGRYVHRSRDTINGESSTATCRLCTETRRMDKLNSVSTGRCS